jgi:hypothetical protein
MHCPPPNEHHQLLARFAGTWHGKETMHPSEWSPETMVLDATTTWRVDLGGFVLITDYEQHKDGQPTYRGHGVYTVDPESNEVVLHWFDQMAGQREEFRGSWTGQQLTLQSKNQMGFMRLHYDLSVDGQLKTRGEMSADGENWKPMFDGEHSRQG